MDLNSTINAGNHEIVITNDVNSLLKGFLNNPGSSFSSVFVISDENTNQQCLPLIKKSLPGFRNIVIGAGELNKNFHTCNVVWEQLLQAGADRKALVINLGGGMVSDLGGFAAATYKRGVRFVNIPTSLLGMVDASSGGKTGIDLNLYKNMVGLFAFPAIVMIDPVFLKTLPEKEWRNGVAEMLKHGIIADKKLWQSLSDEINNSSNATLDESSKNKFISLLLASVKVKADIVTKDPFELNERMYLNFGHTMGHALESYSLKNDDVPLTHGEAIAIGMICETLLSVKLCALPVEVMDEITATITTFFKQYRIPKNAYQEIIQLMKADKKSENNLMTFTLLKNLEAPVLQKGVAADLVLEALHFYNLLRK